MFWVLSTRLFSETYRIVSRTSKFILQEPPEQFRKIFKVRACGRNVQNGSGRIWKVHKDSGKVGECFGCIPECIGMFWMFWNVSRRVADVEDVSGIRERS
jgi:hypothetical protein